jgi:hypothetical protein
MMFLDLAHFTFLLHLAQFSALIHKAGLSPAPG